MSEPRSTSSSPGGLFVKLGLVAVVAMLVGAYIALNYSQQIGSLQDDHVLDVYGLNRPVTNRLAIEYQDVDQNLVADAATGDKTVSPKTLKFNYLAAEQEHYAEIMAPFLTHLGEQLGRPVEYQAYENADKQLLGLKKGEVHIVGLNSGAVPVAVNISGYVPLCSFGSSDGLATYKMQIIVPSESSIKKVPQINGHMLALTDLKSNSGCKAPLMVLWNKFQLQPVRDFDVVYSGGHAKSIKGIASGKYAVAAVASDELLRAIAQNEICEDQFRVIYESESFCNNTFGVPWNLDPALVAKIRAAFLSYPWAGTPLAEEFATIGADRFEEIDYQKEFKLIREIDDVMGRRHELPKLVVKTAANP